MIRRASVADVPQIAEIINDAADYGLMLHRSHGYLYERLRDYQVAVEDENPSRVMGVCGLQILWGNLAELCSLAVAPACRGRGLGRALVEAVIAEARALQIRRVMTLTYEQAFFERLGFEVVDRQTLPLKVWTQCIHCAKQHACDEIAMVRINEEVPDLAPPPPAPEAERYVMPVVLRRTPSGTPERTPGVMSHRPE